MPTLADDIFNRVEVVVVRGGPAGVRVQSRRTLDGMHRLFRPPVVVVVVVGFPGPRMARGTAARRVGVPSRLL